MYSINLTTSNLSHVSLQVLQHWPSNMPDCIFFTGPMRAVLNGPLSKSHTGPTTAVSRWALLIAKWQVWCHYKNIWNAQRARFLWFKTGKHYLTFKLANMSLAVLKSTGRNRCHYHSPLSSAEQAKTSISTAQQLYNYTAKLVFSQLRNLLCSCPL